MAEIGPFKGVKKIGARLGNWLTAGLRFGKRRADDGRFSRVLDVAYCPSSLWCDEAMEAVIESWASLTQSMPEFVEVFHSNFRAIPQLVLETTPDENDQAGRVVIELMMASMPDFDDIMLLCSKEHP